MEFGLSFTLDKSRINCEHLHNQAGICFTQYCYLKVLVVSEPRDKIGDLVNETLLWELDSLEKMCDQLES